MNEQTDREGSEGATDSKGKISSYNWIVRNRISHFLFPSPPVKSRNCILIVEMLKNVGKLNIIMRYLNSRNFGRENSNYCLKRVDENSLKFIFIDKYHFYFKTI